MAIRMKAKSYGPVFVVFDGGDDLQYAWSNLSEVTPCPPSQTPVDTLLASLGACIVKSVQLIAQQKRVVLNPFVVKVVGAKALDLPGRVDRMDVTIVGSLVDDPVLGSEIVTQAKSICTVSNTLTCDVTVSLEADPPE
ncbi:MAG: OsmC family protein [Shimia sp.]|nr:OsmC family protein [Shimia sp.]